MNRRAQGFGAVLTVLVTFHLLVACAAGGNPTATTSSSTQVAAATPTMIVLDASESMNTDDAPGPRLDAAKQAVQALVASVSPETEVGVTAFGSTVPSTKGSTVGCTDVVTVAQLAPVDPQQMTTTVGGVRAQGWSPVGSALLAAAEPLEGQRGSIILVSDGEATCQPDPCATAAQIREQNPEITISAVGFKTASEQLRCIADAGNGEYVTADNTAQLIPRLKAIQEPNSAASALAPDGLYGLSLGDSLDDIRAANPEFPSGPDSGELVVIEWRDCRWHFTDGELTKIEPTTATVATIDGVVPGTAMSRVVELYGEPVSVDTAQHRAYFVADRSIQSAFMVTYDGDPAAGTVQSIVLCRCLPEPSPISASPDPAAVQTGLSALCGNVTEQRTVTHPKLGQVVVGLARPSGTGTGCIAAVDGTGAELLVQKVGVYEDALDFADPITDSTNNVFITYNPGRYNGVVVLVPDEDGFADIGWDQSGEYQSTTNAFYYAELEGPGSDGRYAITQYGNDCEPSCADGAISEKTLRWNGSQYVE
jgi:hypothetical protein